MALEVLKTWGAEILTVADLNGSFNRLLTYIRQNKDRVVGDDAEGSGVTAHNHEGTYGVTLGTDALDDDAVTTAKILDDAVTEAKILDDAVTEGKILDDAVTTGKIIDDAVTEVKIDGLTATFAEINTIADGITATAAEVNTSIDGCTATAAEINTIAVDGKYDSKGMILGDATANRVLRFITVTIEDATAADCIDVSCGNAWNGDFSASASDLGYNETIGDIHLSAGGDVITIFDTGFSGTAVLAYTASVNKLDGAIQAKETFVKTIQNGGDIEIRIYDGYGAENMPSWVDVPHKVEFLLAYITSA